MKREQVILVDRCHCVVERGRVLGLERCPVRLESREIRERQEMLEAGERGALFLHFPNLHRILAEDADRLRMGENVGRVLRRAVRVDSCADGPHLRKREVEERPFESRAGERCESVALADASRQEAVCEVLDAFGGLVPAHVVPVIAVLHEICCAGSLLRDSFAPEARDRAVAFHGRQSTRRRAGTADSGQNEVGPRSIEEQCARPGTDH